MPLLPGERRNRLAEEAGVQPAAAALSVERGLDDLALAAMDLGADPARVLVHVENNLADGQGALTADAFAALVAMETGGDLTATQAKTVLADLVDSGGDPASLAASHGFEAMDTTELEGLVDGLIAEHPDDWEAFVGGDEGERKKKSGFFVGQIMKATRGQADGRVVNEILERRAGNA
jgi:aspartyl-tRNA(Asn)/glutamyl-tRNA(Gln) amidotransferase subunit B